MIYNKLRRCVGDTPCQKTPIIPGADTVDTGGGQVVKKTIYRKECMRMSCTLQQKSTNLNITVS